MSDIKYNHEEWCKKKAVEAFNATWDLMDKVERTADETALMLHTAHASCYLWGFLGSPLNQARSEWQISRAYAIAGEGDRAVYHAERSLKICKDNNYGDFDYAFCFEALVRAYGVLRDEEKKETNRRLALEAAEQIMLSDDKSYFLSELNRIV